MCQLWLRQQSIIVFIWEVDKAWVLCLESSWKSVPTARFKPRRQNKTKVLSLGGRSPQVTHSCSSQGQEGQRAEERRGCRCLGAWLVQGSSVSDSQETRVRHTSGEGQGAADVFDSRSLDGQAVGSGAPQLSPPGALLGLSACYAHLGSEPPFPSMCGRQPLHGPRQKARGEEVLQPA